MSRVAVFDFDRTLIAGSSAQVFSQSLNDVGVVMPNNPVQGTYFRLYRRFGEDSITMRAARYAARLFKGERAAAVEAAGRLAADVLASTMLPSALAEIEAQRNQGNAVLLATTAPREVAVPFAAFTGFDDVLCTRYRTVDGIYDGTTDGRYLWGDDKADAVAEWAGSHTVDLTASSAYTDSWYDLPLLALVGTPIAVNADLRLSWRARTNGWTRLRWMPAAELAPDPAPTQPASG